MKLDKAIEIQQNLIRDKSSNLIADEVDSIKLGIEALKRIRTLRCVPPFASLSPLPGEDPQ